jgi:hypothetical protein
MRPRSAEDRLASATETNPGVTRIAQLQRTVGNHAVTALIRRSLTLESKLSSDWLGRQVDVALAEPPRRLQRQDDDQDNDTSNQDTNPPPGQADPNSQATGNDPGSTPASPGQDVQGSTSPGGEGADPIINDDELGGGSLGNNTFRIGRSLQRQDGGTGDGSGGNAATCRTGTTCGIFSDWSHFQGSPPAGGGFAAQTEFHFGKTDGCRGPGTAMSASSDPSQSWVDPQQVTVNGRRSGNNQTMVTRCQAAFNDPNTGTFTTSPSSSCPAAAASAGSYTATNRGECETVVGAGLDKDGTADANGRLLRHEAYHLNLACTYATIGNKQIDQGGDPSTVMTQVKAANRREQRNYDGQTAHGCNAGPQATWESNIDSRTLPFP